MKNGVLALFASSGILCILASLTSLEVCSMAQSDSSSYDVALCKSLLAADTP